jgi:hypothetical protein
MRPAGRPRGAGPSFLPVRDPRLRNGAAARCGRLEKPRRVQNERCSSAMGSRTVDASGAAASGTAQSPKRALFERPAGEHRRRKRCSRLENRANPSARGAPDLLGSVPPAHAARRTCSVPDAATWGAPDLLASVPPPHAVRRTCSVPDAAARGAPDLLGSVPPPHAARRTCSVRCRRRQPGSEGSQTVLLDNVRAPSGRSRSKASSPPRSGATACWGMTWRVERASGDSCTEESS